MTTQGAAIAFTTCEVVAAGAQVRAQAVSYTHLTLPTILRV